jgi:hypothetical protein
LKIRPPAKDFKVPSIEAGLMPSVDFELPANWAFQEVNANWVDCLAKQCCCLFATAVKLLARPLNEDSESPIIG